MKNNMKRIAVLFVLITALVFNVNYVNAETLPMDEDVVIDTDTHEVKDNQIIAKQNTEREEEKQEEAKVEAKSEEVTKAEDSVTTAKSEQVLKSEAANAPNETKNESKEEVAKKESVEESNTSKEKQEVQTKASEPTKELEESRESDNTKAEDVVVVTINYRDVYGNLLEGTNPVVIEVQKGSGIKVNDYKNDFSNNHYFFNHVEQNGERVLFSTIYVNEDSEFDFIYSKIYDTDLKVVTYVEGYEDYPVSYDWPYTQGMNPEYVSSSVTVDGVAKGEKVLFKLDNKEFEATEVESTNNLDYGTYGAPNFYFTQPTTQHGTVTAYYNPDYIAEYESKTVEFYYVYTDKEVDYTIKINYLFLDENSLFFKSNREIENILGIENYNDYIEIYSDSLADNNQNSDLEKGVVYFERETITAKGDSIVDKEYKYKAYTGQIENYGNGKLFLTHGMDAPRIDPIRKWSEWVDAGSINQSYPYIDENGYPAGTKLYGAMLHCDLNITLFFGKAHKIVVNNYLIDGETETKLTEEIVYDDNHLPRTQQELQYHSGITGIYPINDQREIKFLGYKSAYDNTWMDEKDGTNYTRPFGDLVPRANTNPFGTLYQDSYFSTTYFNLYYESNVGEVRVHLVDSKEGEYIAQDKNGENVEYTHTFTGVINDEYAPDLDNYPIDIAGYQYIGTASTDFKGGADNELQLGVFERQGVYTKEGFDIFFVYKPMELTLSFVTNGGTEVASETFEYNDNVNINNYSTAKEYYYFDGWYKDEALTEKAVDFQITDNTTLYAKWNELDWDVSKSKEASELDENDETMITISLPSAEVKNTAEVVFVLDKSTYSDYPSTIENSLSLLNDLKESNASVKVAIVHFNRIGHPTEWFDVQTQYDEIVEALKVKYSGGSNMHAGLLAAQELLENSTDIADENKFVVLISDGSVYLHCKNGDYTTPYTRSYIPVERAGGTYAYGGYWVEGYWNPYVQAGIEAGNVRRPKVPDADKWEEYLADVEARNNESNGDQYDYVWMWYDAETPEGRGEGYIETPREPRTASNIDIAYLHCYETWKHLQEKFHTYAIGVKDNGAGEGNWDDAKAFMRYLNNNEEPSFDKIKKDMFLVSSGSKVIDYMGNDFDFVNDKDRIQVKVGEELLNAVEISENKYGFGQNEDETYRYTVEYSLGENEHLVWNINENISNYSLTQLMFYEKLVNKAEQMGEYTVLTNEEAVLYPINSEGVAGKPEEFEKPTVTYNVITNGKVIIHYIDKNGNVIHDNEEMEGVVGTSYDTADKWNITNPTIVANNYRYLTSTGKVTGAYTSERPINVTYIYEKLGNVIINYVDEDGNPLNPSDKITGTVGESYLTSPVTISNYDLKETPENHIGTYTEEDITVNYVYAKKDAKVVVHYVDVKDNEIAEPLEIPGKVGDHYETNYKDIDGYIYLNSKLDSKTSGSYTEEQIDVYYVYFKGTSEGIDGLKGDIFIRKQGEAWDTENNEVFSNLYEKDKVDIGTSLEIAPIKQQLNDVVEAMYKLRTGKEELTESDLNLINAFKNSINLSNVNSAFTTELFIPKGIKIPAFSTDNFKLLSLDGSNYEASYSDGMFKLIPIDISENENGTTIKVAMILADQSEIGSNSDYYEDKFSKLADKLAAEPDYLTLIIYGAEIEEGVKNQTLTMNGSVNGSMRADALYYDLVNFRPVSQNRHFAFTWETTQNHQEPNWDDAKDAIITDTDNHNIQLTLEVLAKSTVTTHFVDVDDHDVKLAEDVVNNYDRTGGNYTTSPKDLSEQDYTLVSDSGNTEGTVTEEPIDVTYYYKKNNSTVTVYYKDINTGEELPYSKEEYTDKIGETYTTVQKEFTNTHYEFVKVDENGGLPTGTYTKDPIVVTYYYRWKQGTTTNHYVINDSEEVAVDDSIYGNVDSAYTAVPLPHEDVLKGYKLVGTSPNMTGVYIEGNIDITFYYEPDLSKITVHYIDKDTGTELDKIEEFGTVRIDTYDLIEKSFENYKLVSRPEETTVQFIENNQEFTFEYQLNKGKVITHHIGVKDEIETELAVRESEGIVGTPYTANSEEFTNYTLDQERLPSADLINGTYVADANEETEELDPIHVYYYYNWKQGNVNVHYAEVSCTETEEGSGCVVVQEFPVGEGYSGNVGSSYNVEPHSEKLPENYKLVSDSGNRIGTYTEEDIEVWFYYTKNMGKIIVHYVDLAGNEVLPTYEEQKVVGEAYNTQAPVVQNYDYIGNPTNNASGTYAETDNHIIYVYQAKEEPVPGKGQVIVYHVDGTGAQLIPERIINGTEGDQYSIEPETIPGYEQVGVVGDTTGNFINGTIKIVYVYNPIEEVKQGTVITHHIKIDGTPLTDDVTTNGTEGKNYTTTVADVEGYRNILVIGNTSGTYTDGTIEVTYVYEEIPEEVIPDPVYGTVNVHHIDTTGKKIADDVTMTGEVGKDSYETSAIESDEYTRVNVIGTTTGTYTEGTTEVIYIYEKVVTPVINKGTLIVHHIKKDGTPLTNDVITLEDEGTQYTTTVADVDGYQNIAVIGQTSGTYTDGTIEVTYIYEAIPAKEQGTVYIKHITVDGNPMLGDNDQVITNEVGTPYESSPVENDKYTLISTNGLTSGTIKSGETYVIYIYKEIPEEVIPDPVYGTVNVHHIDTTGKKIADDVTMTGEVGKDNYETSAIESNEYTRVNVIGTTTGTYTEGTTEVIYIYEKVVTPVVKEGTLIVHHIKTDGTQLVVDEISTEDEGTEYTTSAVANDNYRNILVIGNTSGTYTDGTIEVTYVYEEIPEEVIPEPVYGTVNVHHIDTTGKKIADDETMTGEVGKNSYETSAIESNEYTRVNVIGTTTGTYTEGTTEVIYIYEKVVTPVVKEGTLIVHHIKTDGTQLVADQISTEDEGTEYTTSAVANDNYRNILVIGNTSGTYPDGTIEVTYIYEEIQEEPVIEPATGMVIVHHVDGTGHQITDDVILTGQEGTQYTTTVADVEGYNNLGHVGQTAGNFINGTIEVTYIYGEIPEEIIPDPVYGTVNVHHIDTTGKKIADDVTMTGEVGKDTYETSAIESNEYTRVNVIGTTTGTYTEGTTEVIYIYEKVVAPVVKEGTLIVHHIKTDGTQLVADEISTEDEGTEYTTSAVANDNYRNILVIGNTSGTYTDGTIEVTYVYEEIPEIPAPVVVNGTVIVRHITTDGTSLVDEDQVITQEVGTTYTTKALEDLDDYELISTNGLTSGPMVEGTSYVIYIYKEVEEEVIPDPVYGTVNVHHIDTTGKKIADDVTMTGEVGKDTYETSEIESDEYTRVNVIGTTTGTYTEGTTEVIYIYKEVEEEVIPDPVNGNVFVRHITVDGTQLVNDEVITQEVGTTYTTAPLTNDNYKLVSTNGLTSGTIKQGDSYVIYIYKENKEEPIIPTTPETGKVVVRYLDTEGYTIAPTIRITDNVGEEYTTDKLQIAGYKFLRVKGDTTVEIVKGTTYVEYIYEKETEEEPEEPAEPQVGTVIAYYVDENGNAIDSPLVITNTYGSTYVTYQKVIPGYTGNSIPENPVGKITQDLLELTYTYTKDEVEEEPSCDNNCNSCCNCNNGEQQPTIIINNNINNENNNDNSSDNHSENNSEINNENNSDNHSENNNETNVDNHNDINNENNTDVNNENNNQDENNVNIENNPTNTNEVENNTNVETGDTNVDVTTGDTNVENNTQTGDTTVTTGDTNVTTGDTTIENNPTVENNTNVETGDVTTGDTNIENNPVVDVNNQNENNPTNNVENNTNVENNPTNNVENNTDVDASSNNTNENNSNSESNNNIENNSSSESNPNVENTNTSESNPVINLDNSSSSESNPTIENNPTNTVNVEVNPTIENNPTNENNNESNPVNNNDGSSTNTNENTNNNDNTCETCEDPTEQGEPSEQPETPEETGRVLVKYVDEEGYTISPMVTIEGKEGTDYSTDKLRIDGYEFDNVDGEPEGNITNGTTYVTYTYKTVPAPVAGKVIVHYQDTEGNTLADDELIEGNVGDDYASIEKYIEGYELTEITKVEQQPKRLMLRRAVINEENGKGQIKEGTTEITYIYEEISAPVVDELPQGTVIVRYIDEDGYALTPSLTFAGNEGTDYSTDKLKFENYEFDSLEGEPAGQITDGTTYVIYKYKALPQEDEKECCTPTVIVNCNTCSDQECPEQECPEQQCPEQQCPEQECPTPEDPVVEPEVKYGTVITYYYDTEGNELLAKKEKTYEVGENYTTIKETISNYNYKTVIGSANGSVKEGTTEVIYIYEKVVPSKEDTPKEDPAKGSVVVYYKDTKGNKIAGNVTLKGTIGTAFTTFAKDIDNYKLVKVIGNREGNYTQTLQQVTYIYEKLADNGEVLGEDEEFNGTGRILPPNTKVDFNYLNLVPFYLIMLLLTSLYIKKES